MDTPTYDKGITALLVVDPYNDLIYERGKIWPRIKAFAEANNCVPHMLEILNAARKAKLFGPSMQCIIATVGVTMKRGGTSHPFRGQRCDPFSLSLDRQSAAMLATWPTLRILVRTNVGKSMLLRCMNPVVAQTTHDPTLPRPPCSEIRQEFSELQAADGTTPDDRAKTRDKNSRVTLRGAEQRHLLGAFERD